MKSLSFLMLAALTTQASAFAGWNYDHVIYNCNIDPQDTAQVTAATIEIAEGKKSDPDTNGKLQLTGTVTLKSGREVYMIAVGRPEWFPLFSTTIHNGAEWIGLDPTDIWFSMDNKTLNARLEYKCWDGYYSPFGRDPSTVFKIKLNCSAVDNQRP